MTEKYILDISDSLYKGLRAAGVPKRQIHHLVGLFTKWLRSSGPEWTNKRIKDLRQWYESYLAGNPIAPEWQRHTTDQLPVGIWGWVFKLPVAKALAVLSMNTVLYEKELSKSQEEKFLKGLAGTGAQDGDRLRCLIRLSKITPIFKSYPKSMPAIEFPTIFDMTGSIPLEGGHATVSPKENYGLAAHAIEESWKSIPQVTYDFLDDNDLLGYMPEKLVTRGGMFILPRLDNIVGRVSVLQQPELKARIVGNPNRVVQATLEPLKQIYMKAAQRLETDVTHDQQSGALWAQRKLNKGITLRGSDLTSASDLLDIKLCLMLCESVYGFNRIEGYADYSDYLLKVSRADWYCPSLGRNVRWEAGSVLGTGPSFGLLTLTNNAACYLAVELAKAYGVLNKNIRSVDCFRVVGDDVIMRAEMLTIYNDIIACLGGEINHSKTLTSNQAGEFAGMVITRNGQYLKKIKFADPSDNSFMSYVQGLGAQRRELLKRRQRRVYDFYKFVPGFVLNGPWSNDSYGEPIELRLQWYYECVQPVLDRENPDILLEPIAMTALKASLSASEQSINLDDSYLEPIREGYQPSVNPVHFRVNGDPRKANELSLLDALEKHIDEGAIIPYDTWKERQFLTTPNRELGVEESP